jgi:hypothetical protein
MTKDSFSTDEQTKDAPVMGRFTQVSYTTHSVSVGVILLKACTIGCCFGLCMFPAIRFQPRLARITGPVVAGAFTWGAGAGSGIYLFQCIDAKYLPPRYLLKEEFRGKRDSLGRRLDDVH